jgi:hypothetical protein
LRWAQAEDDTMLEQIFVWIIVAAAAVYAAVQISRSFRKGGDHCGDCGINQRGKENRGRGTEDGD